MYSTTETYTKSIIHYNTHHPPSSPIYTHPHSPPTHPHSPTPTHHPHSPTHPLPALTHTHPPPTLTHTHSPPIRTHTRLCLKAFIIKVQRSNFNSHPALVEFMCQSVSVCMCVVCAVSAQVCMCTCRHVARGRAGRVLA